LRIAFIDQLRRPFDRDLCRCESREARDDFGELLLPRRRQDVDGLYIVEVLAGIREVTCKTYRRLSGRIRKRIARSAGLERGAGFSPQRRLQPANQSICTPSKLILN